jgi:hypothetical protein
LARSAPKNSLCIAALACSALFLASDLMAQKTWPLVKRARPGSAMAWLGDIHPANQPDGCDDFLMGYPGQNGRGEVWLVSGKDFRRVKRWIGYANGDGFGAAIAVAEFTGDNVPDYVIGAPGRPENRSGAIGKVYAFDGKTGQQLWQLTGKGITDGFGWALCFADSVPGGNPELWIGAPGYDKGDPQGFAAHGRVEVYAVDQQGTTVLKVFEGDRPGQRIGWDFADAGDLSAHASNPNVVGEGVYISAPGYYVSPFGCSGGDTLLGYTEMFGAIPLLKLSTLVSLVGTRSCYGSGVMSHDFDGVGVKEFVAGSGRANRGGEAFIYSLDPSLSSATLRQKITPSKAASSANFGMYSCVLPGASSGTDLVIAGSKGAEIYNVSTSFGVTPVGDFACNIQVGSGGKGALLAAAGDGDYDGDGVREVFATSSAYDSVSRSYGALEVFADLEYELSGTTNYVWRSEPGGTTFQIDVGSKYAFQPYVVFASATPGRAPFPLAPGVVLRLTLDSWTLLNLSFMNTPVFPNWLGTLDANGRATPGFNVSGIPGNLGYVHIDVAAAIFGSGASLSAEHRTNTQHLVVLR